MIIETTLKVMRKAVVIFKTGLRVLIRKRFGSVKC